jgi:hypothetical protein
VWQGSSIFLSLQEGVLSNLIYKLNLLNLNLQWTYR